jgi:site-specific DNA-methyltransferase (adenine-specific)
MRYLATDAIHEGDARELLGRVQPGTVALSVWSPPYHVGKGYELGMTFEEWRALLRDVIAAHATLLRDGAFLAINIADILCFPDPEMPRIQAVTLSRRRQAVTTEDVLAARHAHPDFNRDQLAALLGCSEQTVDRRLNGNNIRGGKYASQTRVKLVGGLLESLALDAGLYLYDRRIWVKDAAWENSRWAALSYRAVDEYEYVYIFWKPGVTTVDRSRLAAGEWAEWGSRGVWTFPSVRANTDHEAMFPLELPRRCIRLLTDPGELVLDCFAGSGTTAVAAVEAGRSFIGIELLPEYAALARARVAEARAAQTVGAAAPAA